jgi:hypothetical protein
MIAMSRLPEKSDKVDNLVDKAPDLQYIKKIQLARGGAVR